MGPKFVRPQFPTAGRRKNKTKGERMKESSVIGSVSEMTEQVLLPITILLRQSEHCQILQAC